MRFGIQIRRHTLSWLVFPVIFLFTTTNYIINSVQEPEIQQEVLSLELVKANENMNEKTVNKDNSGFVTLWFDDGWKSQYDLGLKYLGKYNYRGVISISTEHVGYESYMNWYQIRRLRYLGWEIASHSISHECDLEQLTDDALVEEVKESKEILLRYGLESDIYVPPCGNTSEKMIDEVQKHYAIMRTVEPGFNSTEPSDHYALNTQTISQHTTLSDVQEWLDETKQNNLWLIITLHQADSEDTEYGTSPEFLNQILIEIKTRELPVVIPKDILNY